MPQATSSIVQESFWTRLKGFSRAIWQGLTLTLTHGGRSFLFRQKQQGPGNFGAQMRQGRVTREFPEEQPFLPENSRYILKNRIQDCIVCDLCAKACPVDCIEIDSVRSPEELGRTSDGKPIRIHALRFDIDMDKCMYCGLCTEVCPTLCLTMEGEFDYSSANKEEFTLAFGKMSADEKEKAIARWQEHLKEKEGGA